VNLLNKSDARSSTNYPWAGDLENMAMLGTRRRSPKTVRREEALLDELCTFCTNVPSYSCFIGHRL